MKKITSLLDRIKTFRTEKRWQSRVIISLLTLIFILGLIRLLLPQTIIYSTTSWLKKQGIDSTIEAININIIDGTVSLVNAKGYQDGVPLFNIGLVDLYWHWAPLSEKTVVVTKVGLDNFSVNIEKYNDKIIIGGVNIPLGTTSADEQKIETTEENKTDDKKQPWAASLGEVIFTDLNICYLQHNTGQQQASKESLFADYCVELEEMSWSGTISYATDKELLKTDDLAISSIGEFALIGLSVTDNKLKRKLLVSSSNTLNNVVISGLNNLRIDTLEMNELSLLQRDDDSHKDAIRFHQLTIDDLQLTNLNKLSIKNIDMTRPGIYLVKQSQTDWEYQQWIPNVIIASEAEDVVATSDIKAPGENAAAFEVALNNININESDLCYLDNETALYYCLTFDSFGWEGSVDYSTYSADPDELNLQVSGDLVLTQPLVHNQSISRDMVRFDKLHLSSLNITGINDIVVQQLSIDSLAALQRGKNTDDTTASFDKLIIKDIKLGKNRAEIKNINLSGLTNSVSRNKDGSWEHDKWNPASKNDAADASKKDQEQTSDKAKEPFIIALNKVNVTSDGKILFTDNTTSPAMESGLQKLSFDMADIYSDKPDSNSPFKLTAKTLRHSTIDLEGTIKPFAEKISLEADGKLKGFDLRAATPVTKKTIGHIIKSGQLDADLKLLAVEGQLDSNIALSLYHFNIEATSKEDAAKLDKKFGMPLNQTLVLLRNKDDSIHLDIPITGDINNPSFKPMDAIIKATSKAATVTLITFYTPYGLIYAGGNVAFNLATALNFDPIQFPPGSNEVSNDAREQLDGLTKLLTEKPQVRLTLCGVTNNQDTFKLFPDIKEQYEANKKDKDKKSSVTEIKLTAEQLSKLEALAKARQVNSKNYLIDTKGIAHDRLILCAPEHDTDEAAIAGVEINI